MIIFHKVFRLSLTIKLIEKEELKNMEKSRIIQGLMRITNLSEEQLYEIIKFDLDNGIYFFDIADIYGRGECEILLGKVLKKHPELREQMFIQTKTSIRFTKDGAYYDLSYEHIKKSVDESLQRMGISYIDSLLLHRPDIFIDAEEVVRAFNELYKEGKVKHFGVSNFPKEAIEYLKEKCEQPIEYNQIQFGLGHPLFAEELFNFNINNDGALSKTNDVYFYLKRNNIQIQAWSPYIVSFFKGLLFDNNKYPELNKVLDKYAAKYQTNRCAIATAFILKLNNNITVITGSTDIKHIKESLEGEHINLSKEDWYAIYRECGHNLP